MLYKQSINFTTQPLVIKTKKVLSHEVLMQISRFIQFVKYDFNMDIHNSSAYLFNASPLQTPTFTNYEFVYYLKKNIECAQLTNDKFNPFYTISNLSEEVSVTEEVEIEGEAVVKFSPIYFNTKPLLEAFVLDTTYDLLEKDDIREFVLETRHFTRVKSKKAIEVKYEIEDKNYYLSKIQHGTVYFHYVEDKQRKFVTGHNIDSSVYLDPSVIVIESQEAINARIIAEMAEGLYTKKQFEDFAFKHRVRLVIYDKQTTSHTFSFS